MRGWEKKGFLLIFGGIFLTLASCQKQVNTLARQAIETNVIEGDFRTIFIATRTAFLNQGYILEQSEMQSGFLQFSTEIPEKNPGYAAAFGFLPGGGSFYTRAYGQGIIDLFLWPFSILWDVPTAAARAVDMKKTIKISVTLVDLGGSSEIRTVVQGEDVSGEYAMMLKRMYAEVKRQTLMREEGVGTAGKPAFLNEDEKNYKPVINPEPQVTVPDPVPTPTPQPQPVQETKKKKTQPLKPIESK